MPLQGWVKSLHCLSIWFVGVAYPPVQCSNTGLKMRNKKSKSRTSLQLHQILLSCFSLVSSESGKKLSRARRDLAELAEVFAHYRGETEGEWTKQEISLLDTQIFRLKKGESLTYTLFLCTSRTYSRIFDILQELHWHKYNTKLKLKLHWQRRSLLWSH